MRRRFTDHLLLLLLTLPFLFLAGCATMQSGSTGGKDPGPTVPPVPLNLSASAGNAQVTLTWAPSTGSTNYHVKRATTSGGPYTQIAAPTSASYTDSSVTDGTTYYYVVSALNAAGESANSTQSSATPTAPIQTPSAPTGLQAAAGNAQVTLMWTASSGASGYRVKRATTSGGPYTQIGAPASASYTDIGLSNGTAYYYVVTALNSVGESANSSQATATPTAPTQIPSVPTGLQAVAGNAQVSLTWTTNSGATSYHVKRATTSGGPYTQIAAPVSTSYTDTSVTNGTTYYYVVSALNSAGESANSTQVSATPTAPTAPITPDVTITIDPTKTHPISPYIYGLNFYSGVTGAPPNLTFDRAGGNRWTAYNWRRMHPTQAAIISTKTTITSAAAPRPPRPCAVSSQAINRTAWPA